MRKDLFPYLIIISTILILIRLFYLQIIDDTLKLKSDNNAIRIIYDYPPRGKIYDRYGKLLKTLQFNDAGWDGTLRGYTLPADDYWFTVDYLTTGGIPAIFSAHFSIKR